MRSLAMVPILLALLLPSGASADERGRTLETLGDLHRACREARSPGRRVLYAIELPPGTWRFGRHREGDGVLPVDTRRNLLALGGAAALIPSHLETVGFLASAERARELRNGARGATLRIGFFLGFDEPERTHCLVRAAVGVTTVRMDVAFVELLGARGRVLAREGGDRLAAWLDDIEQDAVPGTGPRGAIGRATLTGAGAAPDHVQRALTEASRGTVGTAIGRCHADGIERGADPEGDVVVRLVIDRASGRVRESDVELSTLGNRREDECIASALEQMTLPASGSGVVELSVPVRLRN